MEKSDAGQILKKFISGWIFLLITVGVALCAGSPLHAAETEWPREIIVPEAKIVIYQPQLESFKGDKLTARAAVSVTKKGETKPVFGAVWFDARVSTDRNTRMVKPLDVKVTNAKFPNVDPSKVEKLSRILEKEVPTWNLSISLDRLLTMLALIEKERTAAENLNSTPPKIIFVTSPTVLVMIDGAPELRKVDKSNLMQVVNTPFFIVLESSTKKYYLKVGEEWAAASDLAGPWKVVVNPPESVLSAAELSVAETGKDPNARKESTTTHQIPRVIVSTDPAELVQVDGEPKYIPISETDLLYMSNTESDVFMEIGSQRFFVLLAGRWFVSSRLNGPWEYVQEGKLPSDFAKIPADSPKAHVLGHVSGTEQARDAVLDTYIPQTAEIKRKEATVSVAYDGKPKFEKMEGTDMYYAVNTSYSVIRVDNLYYCCHEAVWYVAADPLGPWTVCVTVPKVIYTIPPSYPVYHVKYVYVYDYTPDIVYVGYTPGYVGCYVYYGTVVYGTGYVYHGWYGHHLHYYPRPVTWGYAVHYNSYTGNWAFAVGGVGYYGGGVAVVGAGWRRGGWWGAGGYRDVDISRTVTTPRGTWSGNTEIKRDGRNLDIDRNVSFTPNEDIYNRREDIRADKDKRREDAGSKWQERADQRTERPGDRQERSGDRPSVDRPRTERPADRPKADTRTQRQNNVFSDRDGNVFKKTDKGWQQRDRSGWSDKTVKKPSTGSRTSTSRSSLNRDYQARQRGTNRTNNYQRYKSSGGSRGGFQRSGGGRRGGGRRR